MGIVGLTAEQAERDMLNLLQLRDDATVFAYRNNTTVDRILLAIIDHTKYNHMHIFSVNEFVFSSGQIGEMLHYITYSLKDPQQWMGAVRMRVQTADKNITTIHKLSTPLQPINLLKRNYASL